MAEIRLTPAQQAVVENRGGTLLVSAAAGSGKTKVLVDRLLGMILSEAEPRNIDDFLMITYTKAAAAELRGKILAALQEKLAELPEQDVALYGVRGYQDDDRALLRWGGSLAEFDWSFGGPMIVEPRLWCWDVDDDGQDEVVLVNHVGSGTGVSIEELHIVEKNQDGTLTDYTFPGKLWQKDLPSLLDTATTGDRTFAVLGEELVDITRQLPENLEPEVLWGLSTGSVAGFDTDWPRGADIRFSGSVCLDADGYNSWYVADISAYVSYAGGVFTLSDLHLNSN